MVATIKRTIQVGLSDGYIDVEVDTLDLKDLSVAAKLCRDTAANFRASELCRQILGPRSISSAVYVIAPEGIPACKIGIANHPLDRLVGVQNGNWNKLSITSLLWAEAYSHKIEQTALKAAKEMGISLHGEWIAAEPEEACKLVLKAARYVERPVYDSATWLANWSLRLQAVAEAKGRADAIENRRPKRGKFAA